jgi:hypothetical protein
MQCQYLKKLCSLILFFPFAANAQDITGLWKGTLYNDTTRETLPYEIGISQEKGKLTGFSHTCIITDDKLYFALKKIKVKKKDGRIIIEDLDLIANNSPITPPKGVRKLSVLTLEIRDSIMVLTGKFETNRTRDFHPLTGNVYLQRKNDFRQSSLLPRLAEMGLASEKTFLTADMATDQPAPEEPALAKPGAIAASTVESAKAGSKPVAIAPNNKKPAGKPQKIVSSSVNPVTVNRPVITYEPAAEVNDRKLEMVETVFFKSDSLQLTLYDNGEVDGDTVSVLINGKVIMPKQGLSTKAIRKTIFLPPGTDSLQLIMYAENLGSIPPNTGLLVVQDGDVVYEIRFSADMNKNSAIVFRRKRQ